MRIFIFLIVSFCLFTTGCKKQFSEKDAVVIIADYKKAVSQFDMADMLEDSVEIIPLQTTDQSIIAKVSDVRIIGDEIFVTDKESRKIVAFDRKGNFLRQIGRVGRGEQEYLGLSSSEVTEKHVIIFDHLAGKLYFYNHDGNFIKSTDIKGLWAMDIAAVGDKLYFVNYDSKTDKGYYRLFELTSGGEYIASAMPFDKKYADRITWSLDSYYAKNGDELMMYFPPYDYLYIMNGTELEELFFVDFGPRKAPEDIINSGYDALRTILTEHYISGIDKAQLTDKYIIITFAEERSYCAIYNRETGECVVSQRQFDSRFLGLGYWPQADIIRDNIWIVPMNATAVKLRVAYDKEYTDPDYVKTDFQLKMISLADSLDDLDNPVLFLQKFK